MNKKLLSLLTIATLCNMALEAKRRPNIIFILSDDAGYADFGFQGSEQFLTPHLDSLAQQGMRFTQLYTTDAVSGPSRAGLLSGRYQERFGIEENNVPGYMSKHGLVDEAMGVPTEVVYVSDYLKEAGYHCSAFGKWHLGGLDKYHPLNNGFDHFVGFRCGARDFFPYTNPAKVKGVNAMKRLEYGLGNYQEPPKYLTDHLGDEACKYIEEHQKEPFFMYLAFNAPHTPLQATKEDLARFSHLSGNRQRLAAMTWAMDRACGAVFNKLKSLNLDQNTIIVFTNDNGGPNGSNTLNYPLSGMKATFLEGGIRVPGIISYPKVIKKNTTYDQPVSFMDFLPTFTSIAGIKQERLQNIDGVNILPYLIGEQFGRPHQTLYWKCEQRGAVRDGDWKFMRFPDRPAELYDLSTDIGEHHNLADQHPGLVKRYYKMLSDWEMTLDRPLWMLERKYEERVLNQFYEQEEYRHPKQIHN